MVYNKLKYIKKKKLERKLKIEKYNKSTEKLENDLDKLNALGRNKKTKEEIESLRNIKNERINKYKLLLKKQNEASDQALLESLNNKENMECIELNESN